MDRSRLALSLALVGLLACGGGTPRAGRTLGPKETPHTAALALAPPHTLERGGLVYQVALADSLRAWVKLEQDTRLYIQDDARDHRELRVGPVDYEVSELLIDRVHGSLWLSSTAGWIKRISAEDGRAISEWRMGAAVTALALDADAHFLLSGSDTGLLCLRRVPAGALLQCFHAFEAQVSSIAVLGEQALVGSSSGELIIVDLPSLRVRQRVGGEGAITATSASSSRIAVARSHRTRQRSPELAKREARGADIDLPGQNRIEIWKEQDGTWLVERELVGHRHLISGLAWLGPNLLSCSWDRSVILWAPDRSEAPLLQRWRKGVSHLLTDLATSESGGRFLLGGWSKRLDDSSMWAGSLRYPSED